MAERLSGRDHPASVPRIGFFMPNSHHPPLVGVVLINYKRPDLTLACVASLHELATADHPVSVQVFVVENGSGDDSLAVLSAATERLAFTLIRSAQNTGFSGGCNLGIEAALGAGAAYVWLLNNDATVLPDTLAHLLQEAKRTGGLVSSPLYTDIPDTGERKLQTLGLRLNLWTTAYRPVCAFPPENAPLKVNSLSGASLLIPAEVIRRIGRWDERYFLYFEDTEYTLRAKRAGYAITIARKAATLHQLSASTGGRKNPYVRYYLARNRLLVCFEYGHFWQKLTITACTLYPLAKRAAKSLINNRRRRAEHARELRIETLALGDFLRGRFGPCPHQLPESPA